MQVDLIATLLIQWRKRNLFADDEGFELIVRTIRFGQQNGFRVDLVQRLSSFDPESSGMPPPASQRNPSMPKSGTGYRPN